MLSVVFTWTGGIEKLVVLLNQIVPPRRVFPYPFLKCVLDGLLLLLGKRGLLGVEHALFSAVRILNGVVDTNVAQIQCRKQAQLVCLRYRRLHRFRFRFRRG